MTPEAMIQSIRSNTPIRRAHLRDDELLLVLDAFGISCDLRMHRATGDTTIAAALAITVLGAATTGSLAYVLLGSLLPAAWLAVATLTAAAAGGAAASRLVDYRFEIRLLPGETAELSARAVA